MVVVGIGLEDEPIEPVGDLLREFNAEDHAADILALLLEGKQLKPSSLRWACEVFEVESRQFCEERRDEHRIRPRPA